MGALTDGGVSCVEPADEGSGCERLTRVGVELRGCVGDPPALQLCKLDPKQQQHAGDVRDVWYGMDEGSDGREQFRSLGFY